MVADCFVEHRRTTSRSDQEEKEEDCHANSSVHEKENCNDDNDDDHPQFFSCSDATKKRRRRSSGSSFCVFVFVCVSLLARRGEKSAKKRASIQAGKDVDFVAARFLAAMVEMGQRVVLYAHTHALA